MDFYEYYFRQTAPAHIAVAAFTPDGGRGRAARLFLEWSSAPSPSPVHQWAEASRK